MYIGGGGRAGRRDELRIKVREGVGRGELMSAISYLSIFIETRCLYLKYK